MRTTITTLYLLLTGIGHFTMAQPGSLDPGFDGDGIVTTDVNSLKQIGSDVAVQPDGRILVAGSSTSGGNDDFAVVRYNIDGSLDTGFGAGGLATTPVGPNGHVSAMVLQPDGRILLAGSSESGFVADFLVARYNSDGSLDDSFGVDGLVTTEIGGQNYERATALALQPDGKVLVAGLANIASDQDVAVVRYNGDGGLDTSFNADGMVTTDIGGEVDGATGMALQADGRIVVAAYSYAGTLTHSALIRYNVDGSRDSSFGVDGLTILDFGPDYVGDWPFAVALQPDQRILVAGGAVDSTNNWDLAAARCLASGDLDSSFGMGGKVTTSISLGSEQCNDLALQPDGRILLAGWSLGDFALVRYEPDGSLDLSFGGDGIVTTPIMAYALINGVALRSNGDIIAAGYAGIGVYNTMFAVARYLSGTSLDAVEFNRNSREIVVFPNPLNDVALLEYELATTQRLTCQMLDAQGRTARTPFFNMLRFAGPHRETLDLSGLAAGQYTLVLSNGVGKVSVRVVKE